MSSSYERKIRPSRDNNGVQVSKHSQDNALNAKEALLIKMELDNHIKEYERKKKLEAKEEEEENARIKKQALELLFTKDNPKSRTITKNEKNENFDELKNNSAPKEKRTVLQDSKLKESKKIDQAAALTNSKSLGETLPNSSKQVLGDDSNFVPCPQVKVASQTATYQEEPFKVEFSNFATFGKEEQGRDQNSSKTLGLREVSEQFKTRNTAKFVDVEEFYSERGSASSSLVESRQIPSTHFQQGMRENLEAIGGKSEIGKNNSLELFNKSIETKFDTLTTQLEGYQVEDDDNLNKQKLFFKKRADNSAIQEEREDSEQEELPLKNEENSDGAADCNDNPNFKERRDSGEGEEDTDYEDVGSYPSDIRVSSKGHLPNRDDPDVFNRMEALMQKIKNNKALTAHIMDQHQQYQPDDDDEEEDFSHYREDPRNEFNYENEEDEAEGSGQEDGEFDREEGNETDGLEEGQRSFDNEYDDPRRSELICEDYSESIYEKSVDPQEKCISDKKIRGSQERAFAEPSVSAADGIKHNDKPPVKHGKKESNLTYSRTNATLSGVNALSKNFSSKDQDGAQQYASYDYSQRSLKNKALKEEYKTPSHSELIKIITKKDSGENEGGEEEVENLLTNSRNRPSDKNEEEMDFDAGQYEYEGKHGEMDFMLTQDKNALWCLLKEKDRESSSSDGSIKNSNAHKIEWSPKEEAKDDSFKEPEKSSLIKEIKTRENKNKNESMEKLSSVIDNAYSMVEPTQDAQKNFVNFEIALEEEGPDYERKKKQFELLRKKKIEEFEKEKLRKMMSLQEKQSKKQLLQDQQEQNPSDKYINIQKKKDKDKEEPYEATTKKPEQSRLAKQKEKSPEDRFIGGQFGKEDHKKMAFQEDHKKMAFQEVQKPVTRPVSGHKVEEVKLKSSNNSEMKGSPAKVPKINNIIGKNSIAEDLPKNKQVPLKEKNTPKDIEEVSLHKQKVPSSFSVKSPGNKAPVKNIEEEKSQTKNSEKIGENSLQRNDKKRPSFSKPSNKKLIINALSNVCMAGDANKKDREALLEKIHEFNEDNFIIVFKSATGRQDFKGLYSFNSSNNMVKKLIGHLSLPPYIEPGDVQAYYRYDSGAKEFKVIASNKNFSIAIDAVALKKNK